MIVPAGTISVTYGASQTFTIQPNTGYRAMVSVDGAAPVALPGNSYTFTNVTSPHTIAVRFMRYYKITAKAGAHGSISPSGVVNVDSGANQTFTITPDKDYTVKKILIDGKALNTQDRSYTFENVKATHRIKVTFKRWRFRGSGAG
jgi:hypothetical protein